jgi:hypothetical protein
MSNNWELRVVENHGDLRGSAEAEEIFVPTKTLFNDMQAQLKFIPKNFSWIVGWKSYVWQEKETGNIKDLSEDEYAALLNEGIITYSRDAEGSSDESEVNTTNEGDNSR